jgi:hypothetical protein
MKLEKASPCSEAQLPSLEQETAVPRPQAETPWEEFEAVLLQRLEELAFPTLPIVSLPNTLFPANAS